MKYKMIFKPSTAHPGVVSRHRIANSTFWDFLKGILVLLPVVIILSGLAAVSFVCFKFALTGEWR